MTWAFPVWGNSRAMSSGLSSVQFSMAVMALAMLLLFPASTPLTISSVLFNDAAHRDY
jgi:hypothetical protein